MAIRRPILDELTTTVRSMLAREYPERVLFITGEAGIGKSTLLRQLVEEFHAEDASRPKRSASNQPLIAHTECSTPIGGSEVGQVEALNPFADIMSSLIESGGEAAKKSTPGFKLDVGKFFIDTAPSWLGMIPVLGAPIFHALAIVSSGYDQVHLHRKLRKQGDNSASTQEQVFRQYINFLKKLSEHARVLLILDDFHWADTSSTNLLFAAARDLAEAPIVFLIGYRQDDVKATALHEEHPLVHVRNEIERYSLSRSIEMERIDRSEIGELIRDGYSGYVTNPQLEEWLLRITDGNLLFAAQFLSKLETEHYIEPRTARLLKDLETVSTPSSANAVVVEQIRRLAADEKEQLRYASVEGETITAQMMSHFLEVPVIKIIQRLRKLEEQHHIIRSIGTQALYAKEATAFQFVHYLVHKTLYDDLAEEERAYLHGVAADVLVAEMSEAEEAQHNVHVVAARLAVHASLSGRHLVAAEALLKGAKWVWKRFAADEALMLLARCTASLDAQAKSMERRRPARAGEPVSDDNTTKRILFESLMLRARIQNVSAQYAEARRCYEDALMLEIEGPDSAALLSEAYIGLSVVKRSQGNLTEAEADARTALHIAMEAQDVRQEMTALRVIGNAHYSRGDYDGAMEYYERSLKAAESVADLKGKASAIGNIGNILEERGNAELALVYHRQALDIHRSINDTTAITRGLINIGSALHTKRVFDEAAQFFEEALALARSCGDLRMEAIVLHNMGVIRREQGRFAESSELIQRSLAINERAGDRQGVSQSLGELGMIAVDTDDFIRALDYLTQSLTLADEVGNIYAAALANHNIAFVHLMQGRLEDALRFFDISTNQFAELRIPAGQIESAFGWACTSVKIESVTVSTDDLLNRTRSRVLTDDFSTSDFTRVLQEWAPRLDKLGIGVREHEKAP